MSPEEETRARIERERAELLEQYAEATEIPSLVLSAGWLALLAVDLLGGLNAFGSALFNLIWGLFIIDFAIRLWISPRKLEYIKSNLLTALSLALPALRVVRVFRVVRVLRAARAARSINLLRLVTSINRGTRSLRRAFGRYGLGYLVAITLLIVLIGAAGIFALENQEPGGLKSFGDSLWWTSMMVTTMGSDYWPKTVEGRMLAVFLSAYAVGIFGYLTASLASFFLGREAESEESDIPSQQSLREIQSEVRLLRSEISRLIEDRGPWQPGGKG